MGRWLVVVTMVVACGDGGDAPIDAALDAAPDVAPAAFELDPSYGTGGRTTIALPAVLSIRSATITVMANETVVVTAGADLTNESSLFACRVLANGTRDPAFAGGNCVDLQMFGGLHDNVVRDGDDLLVLSLSRATGAIGFRVRKLLANGTFDPSYAAVPFAPTGSGSASAATLLVGVTGGTQIMLGASDRAGGFYAPYLQRVENGVAGPAQPPLLTSAMGLQCGVSLGSTAALLVGVNEQRTNCPLDVTCPADRVCRFAQCVPPPTDCSAGQACGAGLSCDAGECLPDEVRATGTWIFYVASDLSMVYRRSARQAKRVFALAGGSLLATQQAMSASTLGMWKIDGAVGEDATFGTGGVALADTYVQGAVELPSKEIVVVGQDGGLTGPSVVVRLSATGTVLETVPVAGMTATNIVRLADGKLLIAGLDGKNVVLARLIAP